ncbi:MAG: thioredoxin [Clostridia bacterium]|nr:thioredoxin [Clostridia bacterium]
MCCVCDLVTVFLKKYGYNKVTKKRKEVQIMSALVVNKNNFEEVLKSEKKVLLDFYADWCGPCRMVLPLVEQLADENPQYLIGKVNIDNEPELAQAFDVFSVPTLVVLENGKVVNAVSGARPKNQILSLLEG